MLDNVVNCGGYSCLLIALYLVQRTEVFGDIQLLFWPNVGKVLIPLRNIGKLISTI
jgi:hypothetical protein